MACDLAIICGMAFEADMVRAPGIEVIYGLNPVKLKEDIESAIHKGAKSLLSFGTAAGLSSTLHAGDMVIAREVHSARQAFAADAAWQEKLRRNFPGATIGYIAGVEAPLVTTKDKALLQRDTSAIAADMESYIVAEIAEQHSLPFAVLRVVLDDISCQLPPAALAATTEEGHINYVGLLVSLARNPFQIPALIKLAKAQKTAEQSLRRGGEVIKNLIN